MSEDAVGVTISSGVGVRLYCTATLPSDAYSFEPSDDIVACDAPLIQVETLLYDAVDILYGVDISNSNNSSKVESNTYILAPSALIVTLCAVVIPAAVLRLN